jgi:hypothetical protein
MGTELDPMLQGAYVFGATTSLQNGDEALPTGNGALYFMRPESFRCVPPPNTLISNRRLTGCAAATPWST